jgi:hypothetical protein
MNKLEVKLVQTRGKLTTTIGQRHVCPRRLHLEMCEGSRGSRYFSRDYTYDMENTPPKRFS